MKIMGHRQIHPNWHMLTTEHGVFFGYTEQQVREKAAASRRAHILTLATRRNTLPLLPRQRAVRLA